MNGNYDAGSRAPTTKNGPGYTQAEGIEAYGRGREQMKAQLAKNRCQTSVFDSEPPPPTPDRPLFGKSPRKAVGGRDAEGVGYDPADGIAMYAENRKLAAENKDRKKGAKSDLLDWDATSSAPTRPNGRRPRPSASRRTRRACRSRRPRTATRCRARCRSAAGPRLRTRASPCRSTTPSARARRARPRRTRRRGSASGTGTRPRPRRGRCRT